MSVYFAKGSIDGAVKIGCTRGGVEKRLHALRYPYKQDFELIRLIEWASFPQERWLHRRFAHQSLGRELFSFDETMLTIDPPRNISLPPKQKNMDFLFGRQCTPVEGSSWEAVFKIGRLLNIPEVNMRNWLRNNHVPRRYVPIFLDHSDRLGLGLSRALMADLRGIGDPYSYTASSTGFIGVTPRRRDNKFSARIAISKVHEEIGCFDTAEEAARAYDLVALHFHGANAILNFDQSHSVEQTPAVKKFICRCDKFKSTDRLAELMAKSQQ